MIQEELLTKRAIDVTVDELATVIADKLASMVKPQQEEKKYLRGMRGIMEIFQCSKSKAYELKSSGVLDDAITQHGRTFIIDVSKALSIIKC